MGLCIRATGDNEAMVRASSINVDGIKMLALALSNGCVALSGAVLAQYQGYADINTGIGIVVVGLASVIIGVDVDVSIQTDEAKGHRILYSCL